MPTGPDPRSNILHASLIFFSGFLLLIHCWKAPVLMFDDPQAITENPLVMGNPSVIELFKAPQEPLYFPLTLISYRLDRLLFSGWMPPLFGTWAPGIRFMNAIYHGTAALFLWRVFLLLGFSRLEALFFTLIFAVHPASCEVVCWAAERKTALMGLFGFASIWASLRYEKSCWRTPLVAGLYIMALLGKGGALGLFPIYVLLEFLRGKNGLAGNEPLRFRFCKECWSGLLRLITLAAISALFVVLNVYGKEGLIRPPPGGSVFTAAMSDVIVLVKYLYALFLPVSLSAAYYIKPIVSLADSRLWIYGGILASIIALTIWLAPRRRRAIFGWLWFAGALGPSLNLAFALPIMMQDRYLYLSMPGVFIAVHEAILGVRQLWAERTAAPSSQNNTSAEGARVTTLQAFGGLVVILFLMGGIIRGSLYENGYLLFKDAAEKQPESGNAHVYLAITYTQVLEQAIKAHDPRASEFRKQYANECYYFMDNCPDNIQQSEYTFIAMEAGECAFQDGDMNRAERYFSLAAKGAPWLSVLPAVRSRALSRLALIRK